MMRMVERQGEMLEEHCESCTTKSQKCCQSAPLLEFVCPQQRAIFADFLLILTNMLTVKTDTQSGGGITCKCVREV